MYTIWGLGLNLDVRCILLVVMAVQNGHCEHRPIAVGSIGTLDVGSQIVDHVQLWLILNVIISSEDEIDLSR